MRRAEPGSAVRCSIWVVVPVRCSGVQPEDRRPRACRPDLSPARPMLRRGMRVRVRLPPASNDEGPSYPSGRSRPGPPFDGLAQGQSTFRPPGRVHTWAHPSSGGWSERLADGVAPRTGQVGDGGGRLCLCVSSRTADVQATTRCVGRRCQPFRHGGKRRPPPLRPTLVTSCSWALIPRSAQNSGGFQV